MRLLRGVYTLNRLFVSVQGEEEELNTTAIFFRRPIALHFFSGFWLRE